MSFVDELHALSARSSAGMDGLHDFYVHTQLAWEQLRSWINEGRSVRSRNLVTGTVVTEADLPTLHDRYTSDYLLEMTFQQTVSLFEAFLFDFLRLVLIHQPLHLDQRKQITVGMALSAPDRASLVTLLAERELNQLRYANVRDWFKYMEDLVHLGCPSADEIDRLAEIKASRDILVHNSGAVNAIYLDKAGVLARGNLGAQLDISDQYHEASWQLVKKVIEDVSTAAIGRFAPSPPRVA